MKRILVLTAVLMVTAAMGCRSQSWFNRGAPCNTCAPVATEAYMAAPSSNCMPSSNGSTYLPAPN